MIITENQYKEYIIPGNILKRIVHNEYGIIEHIFEVTSEPYDDEMPFNRIVKKFKYKSISVKSTGRYFVSDLFRGKVELLTDFILLDEFQV